MSDNQNTQITGQSGAEQLETMTFPLHGARLIEASAGTGKTFTIAGLYLRLLLGHGSKESRHKEPLRVSQILVVTFTEAATAELRDRIRSRIHQARIGFLRNQSDDPVIQPLLKEIQDHQWAARVLLNAEREMDEAAVFTIHGFCQRMLTQNAFESGSRFSNEFVTDESKLKAQVVCDYWRSQFYGLNRSLAAEIRNIWPSPDALLGKIAGYLTGVEVHLNVEAMPHGLDELHQSNLQRISKLKQIWREASADVTNIINASDVSKRSFTKKNLPNWIAELDRWAESETTNFQLPDKLEKFRYRFLQEKTPSGKQIPEHDVFHQIEAFMLTPPSLREPLMAHAVKHCRIKLQQAKQQKQWLSFDDLLLQLSVAIDTDSEGILTERISSLYPVAMIDEFQDTDPLQYSIFSRIYLHNQEKGLFMIGDPKQAIYAFRGADIFTYIRARNEVQDHYTLATNWRSTSAMVEGANRLFRNSESPFLYDQDIPFYPVSSRPGGDEAFWQLEGKRQPAMNFWLMESEQPLAKADYLAQMSQATAIKIKSILKLASQGKASFNKNSKQKSAIQAGDIAVLVRTGAEAALVRQELTKLGISSVYLSNRDSVFTSPVACELRIILEALLNPNDERALRSALATTLMDRDSAELDRLNLDELLLESLSNQFQLYHQLWKRRGVMSMLRTVMSHESMAVRLLSAENGERYLTDYLHLAELLQQAAQELENEHALVRWFAEQIQSALSGNSGVSDEQIQRLESEQNLVQIITIHKSKGLEYDLVFVPFVSAYREAKTARYHDQQRHETVLDLYDADESLEKADQERLAEDLRLLYVAVTRAVYGCYIGLAPLRRGLSRKDPSSAHLSAIGYLLQNADELASSELSRCLSQFVDASAGEISWQPVPQAIDLQEQIGLFDHDELFDHSELKDHHDLKAAKMQSLIDTQWRISSYSGLASHSSATKAELIADSSKADVVIETSGSDSEPDWSLADAEIEEAQPSIFTFPKGARAGTFLHTLFEEIDFTLAADSRQTSETVEKLLQSHQYEAHWLPVLQSMIQDVLNAELSEGLKLADKGSDKVLVEMEFLLPVNHLAAPLLTQLSRQYDDLSRQAGELDFNTLKGMLKGFIDLIFEHEGKYYVLDWKSNHLGDQTEDYNQQALEQAMMDHRYDLQYQIYSLALHRFLASRIENYSYQQHFGGVYYLFLRGVNKENRNGVFYRKPDEQFLQQFDALITAPAGEQADD